MIFLDEPRPARLADYDAAISTVVGQLARRPDVVCVYQIGGVADPGISDIDIVAVFKDGASCGEDFRDLLPPGHRRLFAHGLFGVPVSLFQDSKAFTFFHNFKCLHGTEPELRKPSADPLSVDRMRRQWAYEFLLRMLITTSAQRVHRVIKLRGLLLLIKGLFVDLEFLGEKPFPLLSHIETIFSWRRTWFTDRPSDREIEAAHAQLHSLLTAFLDEKFAKEPFCVPATGKLSLPGNISLFAGDTVAMKSNAFRMDWVPRPLVGKAISLQNRATSFSFALPLDRTDAPDIIRGALAYTRNAWQYNAAHLPGFMALASNVVWDL